jgi:hypothetical protein
MAEIGKINHLQVVKQIAYGVYLDAGELGDILLALKYVPRGTQVDDWLDVFIYPDGSGELTATTEKPLVSVGECAYLRVLDSNRVGAFLDWGLPKDLLLPFSEQSKPLEKGQYCAVYVYLDPLSKGIVASAKLSHYLAEESDEFKPRQAVDLLICGRTDLGYKAVINNTHLGLVYNDQVFQPLKVGQRVKGYINAIREDKKIDLGLQLQGQEVRDDLAEKILAHLQANNGQSSLTDKSPPEEIYRQYKVSKKNYKKALGLLYKQRRILIAKDQVTLV